MTDAGRRLRADAQRNHEQLLAAARDVVVERGPGAPLDEVARRAGVGIATLYRRFPDRTALLRAVVVDALQRAARAAEDALAEESDGFAALSRYMHAALDSRVSTVIPVVLGVLDLDDPEVGTAREASAALVQQIVDAAHRDGSLPADVTFGDVGTILVRLSRPLPGPMPPEADAGLAHRHLDLFLAGIRATGDGKLPGGVGPERADLRAWRGSEPTDGTDAGPSSG